MHSTIGSIGYGVCTRGEAKCYQNAKRDAEKETFQVVALRGSPKEKEAEIEDLKHRLECPNKIWSMSIDDPSSPPLKLTMASNLVNKDKRGNGGNTTSTNIENGGDAARFEDASESWVGITDRRGVYRE
ncbi:unnamed protein product [Dovyalis caffra]|uniref:Uncharacterized protein n=1 Tax=Dovyalis caffra TaxID=77055 RepID=A0AAV1RRF8_9ROSI|nr:unnamed protein product [Dovyalis caffra]